MPPFKTYRSRLPATMFDVPWQERVFVLSAMIVTVGLALAAGSIWVPEKTRQLLFLVPSAFFALGKFLPLAGLRGEIAFTPNQLGLLVGAMDLCTVLIVVYSVQGLNKIKFISRVLEKSRNNAILVLKAYPRMRRYAIFAVVLFVLFPISGTGAIGGSFLGVLLGLHRFTLILSVAAGGMAGGLLMAFLATRFGEAIEQLQHSPLLIVGLIVILAIVAWAMFRAHKRALERVEIEDAAEGAEP